MLFLGDVQEHYILSDCWPASPTLRINGGRWKQLSADRACALISGASLEHLFFKLGNILSWWSLRWQGGELVKLLLSPRHFLECPPPQDVYATLARDILHACRVTRKICPTSASRHGFIPTGSKHTRGSAGVQHFHEKSWENVRSCSECAELSLECLQLWPDMCTFRNIGALIWAFSPTWPLVGGTIAVTAEIHTELMERTQGPAHSNRSLSTSTCETSKDLKFNKGSFYSRIIVSHCIIL